MYYYALELTVCRWPRAETATFREMKKKEKKGVFLK